MGSKKKKTNKDTHLVPIQVKGTVYNIHPAVMEGVNNLSRQYDGLLGEYKTVMSMNQMAMGHFKRVVALFGEGDLTEDQKLIIEELSDLLASKEQSRNDELYQQLNPPKQEPTPEGPEPPPEDKEADQK